eukprot:TRINITY_DN7549_c0_g1_i1.p1 TRINITY_DN7549_c0_g1~~TRINITY_DN7549_c0_g1_i1.p1  ORF type:complete len:376 (+),score=40.80 TRINITY_DN7549_c0_g1_i1:131-1258(+)
MAPIFADEAEIDPEAPSSSDGALWTARADATGEAVDALLDEVEMLIKRMRRTPRARRPLQHAEIAPLLSKCHGLMLGSLANLNSDRPSDLSLVFGGPGNRITRVRVLLREIGRLCRSDCAPILEAQLLQCSSACRDIEAAIVHDGFEDMEEQRSEDQTAEDRENAADPVSQSAAPADPDNDNPQDAAHDAGYKQTMTIRDKEHLQRQPSTPAPDSMRIPSFFPEDERDGSQEGGGRRQTSPALRADLLSLVFISQGVTWYTIRVTETRRQWFVRKRYNDFKQFHAKLKNVSSQSHSLISGSSSSSALVPGVPPLPPTGLFGLRHRLNLFNFNKNRFNGLQAYLNMLVDRVGALHDDPLLCSFLTRGSMSGLQTIA